MNEVDTPVSRTERTKTDNQRTYMQEQQAISTFVLDRHVTQSLEELDAKNSPRCSSSAINTPSTMPRRI